MKPLQGHENNMTSVLQTATGASYAASIGTVLAGLTLNEWLAMFGALLALLTYLTNLYFRWEERLQRRELHELKKRRLRRVREDDDENAR